MMVVAQLRGRGFKSKLRLFTRELAILNCAIATISGGAAMQKRDYLFAQLWVKKWRATGFHPTQFHDLKLEL